MSKTTKEKIAVMQAYLDDKKIQMRYISSNDRWENIVVPVWDWINFDYRIKPAAVERWGITIDGFFYTTCATKESAEAIVADYPIPSEFRIFLMREVGEE